MTEPDAPPAGRKKKKPGPQPLPPGEGKRVPLNMRTTKEMREMLEAAAAASGRSLTQEVEYRMERSFAFKTAVIKPESHAGRPIQLAAQPATPAITSIIITEFEQSGEAHVVGQGGITEIRATTKGGQFCDIPYLQVYRGGALVAEFCQHNIIGVYFETEEPDGP